LNHDTTILVGLGGLSVDRVETTTDGVPVVHLVTADPAAAACPSCAVSATRVKEHVVTRPRDLPVGGRPVRLIWHKRRWRCTERQCPRGSFTEQLEAIPARKRLTTRLRQTAGAAVADGGRTVVQTSHDLGISWPVVHEAFTAHAQAVLPAEPEPVTHLGLDETRRGRAQLRHNPVTGAVEKVADQWHTGFIDLTGGQGLLGQVEGRQAATAAGWLAARSPQWRAQVQVVAIDMCPGYRAAVRQVLPHATLVVDHFHVVQLANHTVNLVRRRVTATLRGRRARKSDPEYGLKRRLLRNREDLAYEKFAEMWNRLIDLGAAGEEILAAWIAKEELRCLLALARSRPVRTRIAHRLHRFYTWCADTEIAELHRLAATIEAWWPQIEAFLQTGITNAASEGINRLIKLEARNAFGFRNPTNQRLRSRCATTRRARRQLQPG
jgi:transposase